MVAGNGSAALCMASADARTRQTPLHFCRAGQSRADSRPGSANLVGAFREAAEKDKIRAGPSVYMSRITFQGSRRSPVVALAASTRVFVEGLPLAPSHCTTICRGSNPVYISATILLCWCTVWYVFLLTIGQLLQIQRLWMWVTIHLHEVPHPPRQ